MFSYTIDFFEGFEIASIEYPSNEREQPFFRIRWAGQKIPIEEFTIVNCDSRRGSYRLQRDSLERPSPELRGTEQIFPEGTMFVRLFYGRSMKGDFFVAGKTTASADHWRRNFRCVIAQIASVGIRSGRIRSRFALNWLSGPAPRLS